VCSRRLSVRKAGYTRPQVPLGCPTDHPLDFSIDQALVLADDQLSYFARWAGVLLPLAGAG